MKKTPVTLLTGFLGAGKTTLLNHLLSNTKDQKIAVIVNEFGEIGIDDRLILRSDEEIMEMTTGSICCAAKNDTIKVLEKLIDSAKHGVEFDRVIIETTGLANPLPIIRAFIAKAALSESYDLEAVVSMVDAAHIREQLEVTPEAKRQIAFADILIINKTDLVEGIDVIDVDRKLRAINPRARVYRAQKSQIDPSILLNPELHQEERHLDEAAGESDEHDHDSGVHSFVLREANPLDLDKVARWIGEELILNHKNLMRYKGILAIADMPNRFVFQGVHMHFENTQDRPWKEGESQVSEVVVIGKDLDRKHLQTTFSACVA